MSEWVSLNDWWPDWPDNLSQVEVKHYDGRVLQGILDIVDFFPADGDEVPMFVVVLSDGSKVSIVDCIEIRLIKKT